MTMEQDAGRSIGARLVADTACELGEAVMWHPDLARVLWVDIDLARFHWFDPLTDRVGSCSLDARPGAFVIRRDGGLVVADERGFAFVDGPSLTSVISGRTDRLAIERRIPLDLGPGHRCNDGAADPAGSFWVGTMADDERPGEGIMLRLSPDGTLTEVFDDLACSNGIDWSPDGRTMYYIDSATFRVDTFPFDPETSRIGERAPLIAFDPSVSDPDGLTVDEEGGIWVGLWRASIVAHYRPDGTLDRTVTVDATQVTKPTFGDDDLASLYIVCASRGLSDKDLAEQPLAGGLFMARPGIRGRVPHRFAG